MVTYLYILHCMDFSVNSRWWGEGEMMRPSVQGVDPPVCCTPGCYCYICKRQLCGFPQCAASWMTYARDSFVDSQGGLLSSRGGAQTHWHRHIGTSLTLPSLEGHLWACRSLRSIWVPTHSEEWVLRSSELCDRSLSLLVELALLPSL